MYTRFSGDNGQSPARWLRTLKYELPPTFTASQWLECVDGLLDGKAARWADTWPDVKTILSDRYLMQAKDGDVDTFKTLLLSRFTPADEGLEEVNHLIETLSQNATESLEDYYRRAQDLLHAYGSKDEIDPLRLSQFERSVLNRVTLNYVTGLHRSCLRSYTSFRGGSLLQAYQIIRGQERLILEMGEEEYLKMKNENDSF